MAIETQAITVAVAPQTSKLRLTPFDSRHASTVARWVTTPDQLRLLAPSTEPPLTAAKVSEWVKPGGIAFLLRLQHEVGPIGYGELNPMRRTPLHFWIGHVIVASPHRGIGIGTAFVRLLTNYAFARLHAEKISLVVFPDNAPAIRCYLRAGFTNLGEEHHRFNGTGPKHRLLRFELAPPKLPE